MRVCRQTVMSLDEMIDQKKGFSEGVSDEDWAIIGASDSKMQSFAANSINKPGSPTKPVKETVSLKQEKKVASPEPRKQSNKNIESEEDEESDGEDDYDEEGDVDYGSEDEGVRSPSPKKDQAKTLITSIEEKKQAGNEQELQ